MPPCAAPVLRALSLLTLGLLATGCETIDRWDDGGAHSNETRAASADSAAEPGTRSSWTAFPTGDRSTSVVVVEKRVPAEARRGQPFDVEIVVTNVSELALDEVVVAETRSPNLTLSASEPALEVVGDANTWKLGTLAPKATRTIAFRATAAEAREVATCLSVTYRSSLCSSVTIIDPALEVSLSGPDQILICDELAYRYTVTNNGIGPARGVQLAVDLPQGLTDETGSPRATRQLGTIEAGETVETVLRVRAASGGTYTHFGSVTGAGDLAARSAELVTIVRQPALEVRRVGPDQQFAERTMAYEITVRNGGAAAALETVVEDLRPDGAELISAEGAIVDGRKVRWELGDLLPDEERTVTVRYRTNLIGTLTSRSTARAYCNDPVSATTSTEVVGRAALGLEVVDLQDPVEVGQTSTYVITVENQGSAPATNLKVSVVVPGNTRFVEATGATAATVLSNADKVLTLGTLAVLAPQDRAVWRIVVEGLKPADARFKVSLTGDNLSSPVEETEATNYYE